MRKFALIVLLFLAVMFIYFSIAELENIWVTLQQSSPLYLLAALAVEVGVLANLALLFHFLYSLVGLTERYHQVFLVTVAASFVNMITPSAGIGGMGVFLDTAKRRNHSTGRVVIVGLLYLLYEYAALFCVLAVGFVVLSQRRSLNIGELAGAGFMLLVAGGVALVFVLGCAAPTRLEPVLQAGVRLVNRTISPFQKAFGRPTHPVLKPATVQRFAQDVIEGLVTLRGAGTLSGSRVKLGALLRPLLLTLTHKLLLVGVLGLSFLALGTPVSGSTLIGGFAIGYLFNYASVTPSGVGFVEGILPAALNTLGVPMAGAVLVTLAYRAITLWFPLVVGAVALRVLDKQRHKGNNEFREE